MDHSAVCGILVTFHPDADLPERVANLAAQTAAVVIVDNGSAEAAVLMLRQIAAETGAALLLNPENQGIAFALNAGIRRAAALGFAWVLLVDQDSRIRQDLSNTLLAVLADYPERTRLAVVGAGYHDPLHPVVEKSCGEPRAWDEVEYVITSGSLLSVAAYWTIGPFREDFFIDHVDSEYCARARAAGFHIVRARRALMTHRIGAPTQHQWLWLRKWTTNHGADRRYYFARNDTVMLREYGNYRWKLWTVKSFMRSFRTCKRIALYEPAKLAKIKAVAQGWWDGIHGHMGPRRPSHSTAVQARKAARGAPRSKNA